MLKEKGPIFIEENVETSEKELSVELTTEEKKEIDELLNVDYVLEKINPDENPSLSNADAKKAILAQQKLISFGPRELSYMKDEIIIRSPFMFSEIAFKIAGEENAEELADVLGEKAYWSERDFMSPAEVLNSKLRDLIQDIRKKDPQDKRLERIAESLIDALGNMDGSNKYTEVLYQETLSLTGTQVALDYMDNNLDKSGFKYARMHARYSDLDNYEREHFSSYHFPTLDSYFKYKISFKSGDAELIDFPETDSLVENTDFLSDKEKQLIIKAREMIDDCDLEETIKPLARIYAFNRLKANDSAENVEHIIERIKKLEEREKACKSEEVLPTIGLEIECHYSNVDVSDIKMLSMFSIPNEDEPGTDLWEINPDFSYSALVQARYLQEAFNAELITRDFDENGRVIIPEDHLLSLHVNLGIPGELVDQDGNEQYIEKEFYSLNDLLNYAFTSPLRIRKRKTDESLGIKPGVKKSDRFTSNSVRFWRLELRASEFRDYKTYKMLDSAQKIGAAFFCYAKSVEGHALNQKESEMKAIWNQFVIDYEDIMHKYGIEDTNLFDEDAERAAELAENADLKLECRELIYAYTKRVNKFLFDDVVALEEQ
jgi:hypothetical protein